MSDSNGEKYSPIYDNELNLAVESARKAIDCGSGSESADWVSNSVFSRVIHRMHRAEMMLQESRLRLIERNQVLYEILLSGELPPSFSHNYVDREAAAVHRAMVKNADKLENVMRLVESLDKSLHKSLQDALSCRTCEGTNKVKLPTGQIVSCKTCADQDC